MKYIEKVKYNSPVVLSFTFLSLLVLILNQITFGKSTEWLFCVYKGSLLDPLFYVRLLTHILGHTNWEHYISNFMIILLIGPMLEEKYGSRCLLSMILLTAFVTGVVNVIFFNTALLGASGIVFMMILLSSFASHKEGGIPLTLILVTVLYIGQEVVQGLMSRDNISQISHIIGGICGCTMGFFMNKGPSGYRV